VVTKEVTKAGKLEADTKVEEEVEEIANLERHAETETLLANSNIQIITRSQMVDLGNKQMIKETITLNLTALTGPMVSAIE